jgi:flavin-dependent dehydrogenase
MAHRITGDMMTLQQAGDVLEVSPEFIRRRIKAGVIRARFDRGSPKFGYVMEREEFVRFLRSIGEEERAARVERGILPGKSATDVLN